MYIRYPSGYEIDEIYHGYRRELLPFKQKYYITSCAELSRQYRTNTACGLHKQAFSSEQTSNRLICCNTNVFLSNITKQLPFKAYTANLAELPPHPFFLFSAYCNKQK